MTDFKLDSVEYLQMQLDAAGNDVSMFKNIISSEEIARAGYAHLDIILKTIIPIANINDDAHVDNLVDLLFTVIRKGYQCTDAAPPIVRVAHALVAISIEPPIFSRIWAHICRKICEVDLVVNDEQLEPIHQDRYLLLAELFKEHPEYNSWLEPWLRTESKRSGFESYYMSVLQHMLPQSTLDLGSMLNLSVLNLYALHLKIATAPIDSGVVLDFELS